MSLSTTIKTIQDIMRNILKLKVPVVVDLEIGDNWGKMEKLENKK